MRQVMALYFKISRAVIYACFFLRLNIYIKQQLVFFVIFIFCFSLSVCLSVFSTRHYHLTLSSQVKWPPLVAVAVDVDAIAASNQNMIVQYVRLDYNLKLYSLTYTLTHTHHSFISMIMINFFQSSIIKIYLAFDLSTIGLFSW